MMVTLLRPIQLGSKTFLLLASISRGAGKAVVGQYGPGDLGGAAKLPRSLHYATRRTHTVRGKKPGRFGRDDEIFVWRCFPALTHLVAARVGPEGLT